MGERQSKKDLRRKYPDELKRKIAKAYESGQYSYGALAEQHGLRDRTVVKEFVKWHRRQELLGVCFSSRLVDESAQMKQIDYTLEVSQLRAELGRLRLDLSHRDLKVESLETMIDLAEQEFSIAIRKKSGTQRSIE